MNDATATPLARHGFADQRLWSELIRAMGELECLVWNDPLIQDELTRAEGLRYLTRLIAGALPMTLDMAPPEHPQLFHFLSTRIHWGLPATDCNYHWAAVHGDHVYRISGDRGSAHIFDIETRSGHIARTTDWQLCDRRSDFEVGPDNQVEVVLSRTEQPGNWIRLPEGPANIVFRQYYYDWNTERSARLRIRCEGASYPPPPLTAAAIAARAELLIDWLCILPDRCAQVVRTYYQAPPDSLVFDTIDFGWKDLKYGKGTYQCAQDEALILEVKLPEAPYWSIQLASHFWEARDWHLRQTSLNGHQAQIDDDGLFRAVISHGDPGVPNWLDAGGHERGLIAIRYYRAPTTPIPTIRRVKLAQLRGHLPSSTPALDAARRQELLRQRADSVTSRGME
jgi:hypothetical protein